MRHATIIGVLTLALLGTVPAHAGTAKRCRKLCKPKVTECLAATGLSRRKCKRAVIRLCKETGIEACTGSVTPTTTPVSTTTTTTTLPKGPGFLGFYVEDYTRERTVEPNVVRFLAWFDGDEAIAPTSLDPANFRVDDGAGNVYPAEPASDPEDCSAAMTTLRAAEVTCWVTFHLPGTVGAEPAPGELSEARLVYEAGGYLRRVRFTFRETGGTIGG